MPVLMYYTYTLRIRILFCLVFLALLPMTVQAQYAAPEGEFMTQVFLNTATLNAQQQQMTSKIQNNPHYKQIQYVQMGSLAKSQKKGILTFTIPGQKKPVSFKVTSVEAQSEYTYNWSGTLVDGVGSAIVISDKGTVYGSIQVEGQMYRLYGLDKGKSILLTIDEKSFGKEMCNLPDPVSPATENHLQKQAEKTTPEYGSQRVNACYNPIRILILVTPGARQEDPDIEQTARTGLGQFNAAISNSGITSNAKLELAGIVNFEFLEYFSNATYKMHEEVNRLATSPQAQVLRTQYRADIVVMLTATGYVVRNAAGYEVGHIYGRVQAVDSERAEDAYALVEASAVGSRVTFPHEVGHLFGGRHQNDYSGKVYAHGYYFERRRFLGIFVYRYATLMHTYEYPTNQGVSRPFNFSNPAIQVDGAASGDYEAHHVARRINETAARMANFQPPVGTLSTNVLGRGIADREGEYSYEASVTCGQAPYTYQWAASYDGFNYDNLSEANADTYSFYVYPGDVFDYYLRVTVTAADGQTSTAFQHIQVHTNPYIQALSTRKASSTPAQNILPVLNDIVPNPVATEAAISFILPSDSPLTLEVMNSLGQRIHILVKGTYLKGHHTEQFETHTLPNGVYFYRLTTPDFTQTKRFVILR